MNRLNDAVFDGLEVVFGYVELLGWPLAVAAWLTVFGGTVALTWVLRKHNLRPHLVSALVIGGLSLAAHQADISITLKMSPDLALEANPIWNVVVETFGLKFAIWYGLTGKWLLSILCFQTYLLYRVQRGSLMPEGATGFREFWRRFGENAPKRFGVRPAPMLNFFAFAFAVVGPFSFYVAFVNGFVDNAAVYTRLPPMPLALGAYLAGLVAAYLWGTWRAARTPTSQSAPA